MHILTFIACMLMAFGTLCVGAKVFVTAFAALTKTFHRFGLFLMNKYAITAMRSVQAVIKSRTAKAVKQPKAVVEFFPQTQNIIEQDRDLDYLEIPSYLRKGDHLVW